MKRIPLRKILTRIVKDHVPCYVVDKVIKIIQNGYRRRQHHKKGYSCHCGKFHKPMQLCKRGE